jgi:hypothetical protein
VRPFTPTLRAAAGKLRGLLAGSALLAGGALAAVAAEGGALVPPSVDPERLTQVRAAFLLNFVRYTEWPASSFESEDSPYFVVVVDDDGVATALRELAERAGKTDGRALRVLSLRTPERAEERTALVELARRSHVAYLGEKPDHELLAALSPATVLTVAADDAFVRTGGMIALVVDGGRVTFDVDPEAIRARGLMLSSRVLRLARNVAERR